MASFDFNIAETGFGGTVTVDTTSFRVTSANLANAPVVSEAMKELGRSCWWLTRTRLGRGVYLNFNAFPVTIPSYITQIQNDEACRSEWVLTNLFKQGWDVKPSTPVQSLALWWVDSSVSTSPGTTTATIGSQSVQVDICTMQGFDSVTSQNPAGSVIRAIFIPYLMIQQVSPSNPVNITVAIPSKGSAQIAFNTQNRQIVAASFPSFNHAPYLDALQMGWFQMKSSHFPTGSENNEPSGGGTGPTMAAYIDTTNLQVYGAYDKWIGRELFLDGPGYVISGSPTLKSVVIWWLEEVQDANNVSSLTISITDSSSGQPLNHALLYTASSNQIKSPLGKLIWRMIQIPYDQF